MSGMTKEQLEQQLAAMTAQMEQMAQQLQQQQQPQVTAASVISTLSAAPKAKTSGLGYMWGETTHAVGSLFGAAGVAADSAKLLAKAGRNSAVLVQLESGAEVCKHLGIEASSPIEAALAAEAVVDYLCDRRK